VRAFLAIPVQAPALDVFKALRAGIVDDVPAVRWAPADSAHITLHFFGAITTEEADRALTVLRPVMSARPRMTLRLLGLGSFPPRGRARVLWWGVDGDVAALSACARASVTALRAVGFPVEDRTYRPHCTLGRPRQPWPPEASKSWRSRADDVPVTPAYSADRAVLYESLTTAGGTVHLPRDVLLLSPA
jgi:2'-5' RNA ligase